MTATNPGNPYLNEPDQPIIAIFRLMRQLPDDITNAGSLTHDQAQMAFAVASYATDTHITLVRGLAEIGKLMHEAGPDSGDRMPHFGPLIQHLAVEAEFMWDTACHFRDVVKEYCR
jgi:hypothetical protein